MSIPDFQSMMLPVLQLLADGNVRKNREIEESLASQYALNAQELTEKLQSGAFIFQNRIAWAKGHLKKAGLLENPARGAYRITDVGKKVLSEHPNKINIKFLNQFSSYDWYKSDDDSPAANKESIREIEEAKATPEELLDGASQAIRRQLASELLDKLKVCSPAYFEKIVVQVLVAMGYGGSFADAAQVVGKSGDGGIDGLIKEDKLGLDVLCVQAKRWPENVVGRPEVQAFAGSMQGHRVRKGVLITTSTFSKEAHEFVNRIEIKIVLIDGHRLAEFMIEYGVGVTVSRQFIIKKIDLDYFIEGEE